jgi:hypothetical protein
LIGAVTDQNQQACKGGHGDPAHNAAERDDDDPHHHTGDHEGLA